MTGEISGTPTVLQPSILYTLTASGTGNYTGTVNIEFSLTVIPSLRNTDNVSDAGSLELNGASSLTTAVVSGTTYLFVAGVSDHGVSVFSISSSGTLVNADNVPDAGNLELNGASALTTTVIDETTYLFVAGLYDDGVSVFAVSSDGMLMNVDNVSDAGSLELNGANSLTTTVIDGTTYLFVSGKVDDGVSVFSVSSGGTLINVNNISDTGSLELNGANSLTTTMIDETTTYLFVGGQADNGVSVFVINPNGILTNVVNIRDTRNLELNEVSSLTTTVIDGVTYLFAVGNNDDGISVFEFK